MTQEAMRLQQAQAHTAHWRLARYGLAARHLGQFNSAYLTSQSPPSWPWLSTGWLRGWVAQRAPDIAILRQHREPPVVRRRYPGTIVDDMLQLWEERHTFLNSTGSFFGVAWKGCVMSAGRATRGSCGSATSRQPPCATPSRFAWSCGWTRAGLPGWGTCAGVHTRQLWTSRSVCTNSHLA